MSKKWIQGAVKRPGAFKAKAKRAGMSTSEYAHHVRASKHASVRTKKQANLALTLRGIARKHKKRKKAHG